MTYWTIIIVGENIQDEFSSNSKYMENMHATCQMCPKYKLSIQLFCLWFISWFWHIKAKHTEVCRLDFGGHWMGMSLRLETFSTWLTCELGWFEFFYQVSLSSPPCILRDLWKTMLFYFLRIHNHIMNGSWRVSLVRLWWYVKTFILENNVLTSPLLIQNVLISNCGYWCHGVPELCVLCRHDLHP